MFGPLRGRAGLPRIGFYDLRHRTATHQLDMGAHPKLVANMLGRASLTVILDTYSHVVKDVHRQGPTTRIVLRC